MANIWVTPSISFSSPFQPLSFFSAQSLNELALTPWALHYFHSRLPIKQCELNSLSGWPRDLLSVSPNHQSQLSCYISVKLSSSSLFSLLSRWWHIQLRCGDLCRPKLYCSFQWGASLLKHTHVYTRKKVWAHLCLSVPQENFPNFKLDLWIRARICSCIKLQK